MIHANPGTTVDVRSMALTTFTVTFHGVTAHAAVKPEAGRSALDALLLSFQGIEFMREHVADDVRMHVTAVLIGAKILAATAHDLICDAELMNQVKKEFEANKISDVKG
ncbi:MAG TPA: hypothetical protein VFF80_05635 [Bacillota bacterium]|nr:hypothetical protein [Bacillota bacterium]